MTITKERETTRVRHREELHRPKAPPVETKAPPIETKAPPIEKRTPQVAWRPRPRQVRWLPWMAGFVALVALTSALAIVLTTGDEVAEVPEIGTELTTPALSDIDTSDNPEILRTNPATLMTTPALSDIDTSDNPEILRTAGT